MPRKPEPKFTVIYNKKPIMPVELHEKKYEEYLNTLIEIYKANTEVKNKINFIHAGPTICYN